MRATVHAVFKITHPLKLPNHLPVLRTEILSQPIRHRLLKKPYFLGIVQMLHVCLTTAE